MSQPGSDAYPPTNQLDLASEFLDRQTTIGRIRQVMHKYPALSPGIVIIVAVIVFGLLNPRFF
ncbi:MAG: ABC transporter permease, partial [Lacisediminihabitans sp.]